MATNRTFRGVIKPFGAKGHFNESQRHSMQAKGFKTGNLANPHIPKTIIEYNVQGNYGRWEDVTAEDTYKEARQRLKEYNENEPYPHRIIRRRIPNPSFLKDSDHDGVPDKFDCKPSDPNHQDEPKTFRINDKIAIVAEYKNARDGFNHFATLYINGEPVQTTKAHYINRTWEAYDFQSVMQQLVQKAKGLSEDEKKLALEYLNRDHTDWGDFKTTAMIAKLGDIMTSNKKESNDWKERMLKAGLGGKGLEMPDDWDKLDEKTKEARLNSVISMLKETGQKESTPPTHEIQQEYELPVRYNSRKSFYGLAHVRGEDGKTILKSYGTDVAYIKDSKAFVKGTYSQTTLRHIKEFLKQNGFKAETSSQILKDYGKKEE